MTSPRQETRLRSSRKRSPVRRSLFAALLSISTLSPALALAEATVYVERATVKVQPNTPVGSAQTAQIKAARNEFEAFQVVVHANGAAVDGVSAQASDLKGPGGATIPAGNVSLYREALLQITTPTSSIGQTGAWPDALVPDVDEIAGEKRNAFPFSVPANESRAIWVDVQVPARATPGLYRGTVSMTGAGLNVSVPVELQVWGFALPSTPTLSTAFLLHTPSVAAAHGGADQNEMAQKYERMALDHRLTLPNVFVVRPSGTNWTSFDQNYAPFLDGTAATRLSGAKMTSAQYPWERTSGAVSEFARHFRERGWFDRVYDYTGDEPPGGTAWSTIRDRSTAVKAGDSSFRTLVTTTKDAADNAGVTGLLDVLVPVINFMQAPGQQLQRSSYDGFLSQGKTLWMYQSCMSHGCGGGTEPGADWPSYMADVSALRNRLMQWADFEAGVSGELYYETAMTYSRDPWQSIYDFGGNGDGTFFYPGTPARIGGSSQVPVASIRLKMLREGVEDYEYLATVSRLGDPAFAQQIAKQVLPALYRAGGSDPSALEQAREQLAQRIMELGGGSIDYGDGSGSCATATCGATETGSNGPARGCGVAGGALVPLFGIGLAAGSLLRRRRQ